MKDLVSFIIPSNGWGSANLGKHSFPFLASSHSFYSLGDKKPSTSLSGAAISTDLLVDSQKWEINNITWFDKVSTLSSSVGDPSN